MSVYKDSKRNTWYVQIRYKDWTGKTRHTCKRWFPTKAAAKKYEMEFLNSISRNPEITFANLVEKYMEDMRPRLKPTTIENKQSIYNLRIIPYLGDLKISRIDTFVSREFKRVTQLAGLPPIRMHDLCHSHVSMLIHMGVDIKVISERLGHESVKTTWDTYGHLYPDSDKAVSDKLQDLKKGKKDEDPED